MSNLHFNRIYERDMDLALMRLFYENGSAAELFYKQINLGTTKPKVLDIETNAENIHGESDLEIVVEMNGKNYLLMIEDKIDAQLQPDQFERYTERGNKCKAEKKTFKSDDRKIDIKDYFVFIACPKDYVKNITKPDDVFLVAYEEILEVYKKENQNGVHDFDIALLNRAIDKKANRIYDPDPIVTEFWVALYGHGKSQELGMKYDGESGHRTDWVEFDINKDKCRLCLKGSKGYVDLMFLGEADSIDAKKEEYKDCFDKSKWVKTGNSATVRYIIPKIDFSVEFKAQENKIDQALRVIQEIKTKLITKG